MYQVHDSTAKKIVRSPDYNYIFNKNNGFFVRWGKTKDEDPQVAPAPEILDIEVTEICNGPGGIPCPFCYKSNGPHKKANMSFETFKRVLDKFPNTLTQIAIGADAQCKTNPDIFKMMEYTRSKGIIPNITVADIDLATAKELKKYCGAVAVSRYENKSYCYDSIENLALAGMKYINIHMMLSHETLGMVHETMADYHMFSVLEDNLTAIVLLSLKKKGRGRSFNVVPQYEFDFIVNNAFSNKVPLGFDSCSANKFMNSIKIWHPDKIDKFELFVEPCESGCFSSYVNVHGDFYPCSFVEGVGNWTTGINVENCDDFITDVWNHPRTQKFRDKLIYNNRNCPVFEV